MAFNREGRPLLTLKDYSPEGIRLLPGLFHELERQRRIGVVIQHFVNKTLALLFEKRSARTWPGKLDFPSKDYTLGVR